MNESILIGLLIFGIIQSFFFILIFSAKRNKNLSDRIMGIWLLVLAIQTFLILLNVIQTRFVISNFSLLITTVYGPFLFLYVSKLTTGNVKLTLRDYLHFIPFVLFLAGFLLFPSYNRPLLKILSLVSSLSGLFYCIITLYKVQIHKTKITNEFSYFEKINLVWVYKLTIGMLIIWTGVFLLVILTRFFNAGLSLNWFFIVIPLFIFYIGYYGVKQQLIYPPEVKTNEKISIADKNTYRKSGLDFESMEIIYKRLTEAMDKDKLYSIPTLSLTELSSKLKTPSHHITQTLNDYAKESFYDFVNKFRVEEFKMLVQSGKADKFSLIGIAMDCGFNSKSSFNRIFKKFTGQTPSEYKKSSS